MKHLLLLASGIGVALTIFVASALPAFGGDSGTATLRVTAAAPCLTVGADTIDFGVRPFHSGSLAANGHPGTPTITVTNCSPLAANVYGRGTNATGGSATWELVTSYLCSSGDVNKYALSVWDGPFAVAGANATALTTTNQALFNDAGQRAEWPAGHSQDQLAQLFMPCTGSDGVGEEMSMQIVYTATF